MAFDLQGLDQMVLHVVYCERFYCTFTSQIPPNLIAIKIANMWQVFKMSSRQMDLLLRWPPGAGSSPPLPAPRHLPGLLSERATGARTGCIKCGSQGRPDRLSASLTLRDTFWLHFSISVLVGVSFIRLLFYFGRWAFKDISLWAIKSLQS